MMVRRYGTLVLAAALTAGLLAGCSSARSVRTATTAQPETLTPIQSSTVTQSTLPTIGRDANGQPLSTRQINPNLTGAPAETGPLVNGPLQAPPQLDQNGIPINTPTQTADSGSFVTLDPVGQVANTGGRDFTGGLTVEKLLGGWTIVSGQTQCRLNLTQTAKAGTDRYRASTPGCALAGLDKVAS